MEVFSRLRQVLATLLGDEHRQFERQLPPGDPRRTDSLVDGVDDGGELVASLREGGVLVQQGEGVVLTTGFAESWREQISQVRDLDDAGLADAVESTAPGVERAVVVEDEGRDFVVVEDGTDEALWVSRPVAIAEVAALRSLPPTVEPEYRLAAARPLRLFLEECPDCEGRVGTVAADDWPTASGPDDATEELLVCYDCGEQLYTY